MFNLKNTRSSSRIPNKLDSDNTSPISLATVDNANDSRKKIKREDSFNFLQDCCVLLQFAATQNVAAKTKYAELTQNSSVNPGPIVLFRESRLTTNSIKYLVKVENAHPIFFIAQNFIIVCWNK